MTALTERVQNLGAPRILILGDLILDEYVLGDVSRISPEAPIPVLDVRREDQKIGGAGNVAANVVSMGGRAGVLGAIGKDRAGDRLVELLETVGIDTSPLIVSKNRRTTIKSRHMAGPQQLVRVDREDRGPLPGEASEQAIRFVRANVGNYDLLIISDYGKGVLTRELLTAAIEAAKQHSVRVLVDPKGSDFSRYRGASIVTPNRAEAELATGCSIRNTVAGTPRIDDLVKAGEKLLAECDLEAAIITLGKDGVFFLTKKERVPVIIPTHARQVYDVTGAGDTVIAHLGLHLADGASIEDAVRLANAAAGIVVARLGTAVVKREELLDVLAVREPRRGKIIQSHDDLDRTVADLKAAGRTIVFTNGVFDILHAGHVRYLRDARASGDFLIVGINDDGSVRRIKGEKRPVNPIEDRMSVLAGLEMVDCIVSFSEDTPLALIQRISPGVLIKGEDWAEKGVIGREWVETHGGRVLLMRLEPGRSTTNTIQRIIDSYSSPNNQK
ncbi:MAG: D-glycero-beta-D-manno-heptose-7-phosphate kinase [Planctomycetes bacterium]|nr:D-glycero-beta-D-manno-heptose-7-phosphate kinase [Planctomycetota bacterium]